MTGYYTADYLYNEFKTLAGMRKSNPAYANDHTYWDDGHCGWGASHVLRADCETIARGMAKLESLNAEDINSELNKCVSQDEYNSKKNNYIRKVNEISSGLQVQTGASSSMFGICIIWSQEGMNDHVESKMQECRRKLEDVKSQLNQGQYQRIEKLRHLQLEQKKIETRMKQRQREAQREKDPAKKATLLLLIESDAKELEANLKEQQAIPKSGIDFNPREYVDKIINGIRDALREKARGGSGNSGNPGGNRRNKDKNKNGSGGNGGGRGGSGSDGNQDPYKPPRVKKEEKNEKDNSQILLIIVAVIVIFFLMSQKDNSSRSREYEEFDYY